MSTLMNNTNLAVMSNLTAGTHEFWDCLDHLVADNALVINHPKGSQHLHDPSLFYPLDYGYLESTEADEGDRINLWLGSLPEQGLDSVVMTVDLNQPGTDVELLLGCNDQEKLAILDFLNANSMRAVLVPRLGGPLGSIRTRRSIRRFLPQVVDVELIRMVLEAATWAPSAHHRQPWRFVVLSTTQSRQSLANAMSIDFRRDLQSDGLPLEKIETQVERSRHRITEAPVAILLCLDSSLGDVYPDARRLQSETIMGVQSVAMAGENLLLAAHSLGLGGVWICAPLFAQETVRRVLNLPGEWQPQGLVLLGYPAKIPELRPRRPLDETAVFI
jgi:coenzyme F420-0:L-glutamate ligase/coenzyme F420-1:gamma-L-glutamate ligase